tara:strand:+ start:529 stop:942 length:414 start_codon:yes stop_codon:yes gene_type:complete
MAGRVLVSNRGEGNWSTGNVVSSAIPTIHFPHGAASTDAPSDAECFGADFDHLGWGSKTNWMIQLVETGTCVIDVFAVRPSGIEELILADAAASLTQGGIGDEEIYGPVKSFRFRYKSGAGSFACYITAWNYGDINT